MGVVEDKGEGWGGGGRGEGGVGDYGLTPWAVMVEALDADVAFRAMRCTRGSEDLAGPAPLERDAHACKEGKEAWEGGGLAGQMG